MLVIFSLKAQTIERADFVLDLEQRTKQNGSTSCWGYRLEKTSKTFSFGPFELRSGSRESEEMSRSLVKSRLALPDKWFSADFDGSEPR